MKQTLSNIFWLGTKELRSFFRDWVLLGLVTNGNCTDRFTFVNVYSQQSWLNTFEQNYK